MRISLKFIGGLNHAKSTIYRKFRRLPIFSSPFTGSSILPVFALSRVTEAEAEADAEAEAEALGAAFFHGSRSRSGSGSGSGKDKI